MKMWYDWKLQTLRSFYFSRFIYFFLFGCCSILMDVCSLCYSGEKQLHRLYEQKLRPLWHHEEMSKKVFCDFGEWPFNTHCLAEGHHQNNNRPLKDCGFNQLLIHVWHTITSPFSLCCLLPSAVRGSSCKWGCKNYNWQEQEAISAEMSLGQICDQTGREFRGLVWWGRRIGSVRSVWMEHSQELEEEDEDGNMWETWDLEPTQELKRDENLIN